jgi:general stress protein 26
MLKKITEMMRQARNHCFLATCDNSQPMIRVMSPFIEDNLAIWLLTFRSSDKVGEIRANPNIALSFSAHPGWEFEVVVKGEAHIREDAADRKRIWELSGGSRSRYFPDGPDTPQMCLLRVLVREIRFRENAQSGFVTYKPDSE